MKKLILILGIFSSFASNTQAQCHQGPFVVSIEIPEDGISIQTLCFEGITSCILDTFYRETLIADLQTEYETKANSVLAVIMQVDSGKKLCCFA